MGKKQLGDTQGFSLIELLAVLGVITLLIAALVPFLSHGQQSLKKACTALVLENLTQGIAAFHYTYGRYPACLKRSQPVHLVGSAAQALISALAGSDLTDNPKAKRFCALEEESIARDGSGTVVAIVDGWGKSTLYCAYEAGEMRALQSNK